MKWVLEGSRRGGVAQSLGRPERLKASHSRGKACGCFLSLGPYHPSSAVQPFQGLKASFIFAVQTAFENLCHSELDENTRKRGGNARGTGEHSRRKAYFSVDNSLLSRDSYFQE